jgi:hypothetical protein
MPVTRLRSDIPRVLANCTMYIRLRTLANLHTEYIPKDIVDENCICLHTQTYYPCKAVIVAQQNLETSLFAPLACRRVVAPAPKYRRKPSGNLMLS